VSPAASLSVTPHSRHCTFPWPAALPGDFDRDGDVVLLLLVLVLVPPLVLLLLAAEASRTATGGNGVLQS